MRGGERQETGKDGPSRGTPIPRLYVRRGERVDPASDADKRLVQRYPDWPDKGEIVDGRRITIMTAATTPAPDEEVRVAHVFEALEPGEDVYIMGPKPVYGEYVDGKLATETPQHPERPWTPAFYAGATLPSPAVDYSYEITSYRFAEPGEHTIVWDLGLLRSNRLTITVSPRGRGEERA